MLLFGEVLSVHNGDICALRNDAACQFASMPRFSLHVSSEAWRLDPNHTSTGRSHLNLGRSQPGQAAADTHARGSTRAGCGGQCPPAGLAFVQRVGVGVCVCADRWMCVCAAGWRARGDLQVPWPFRAVLIVEADCTATGDRQAAY